MTIRPSGLVFLYVFDKARNVWIWMKCVDMNESLHIYMCVPLHINTHVCASLHIYTHVCITTYIHTCLHHYIYTLVCHYISTRMCASLHTYIRMAIDLPRSLYPYPCRLGGWCRYWWVMSRRGNTTHVDMHESCHTHGWVMWHTWTSHVKQMYKWC